MEIIHCSNIDDAITEYSKLGYRLEMIMPADSPREVQLSKNEEVVRLVLSRESIKTPPEGGTQDEWTMGRAGMMYRDLLADRSGGTMAVSHIRLTEGGPVPDYVHYHKIDF